MSAPLLTHASTALPRSQRVGLVLAALLGIADVVAVLTPVDPNQPGPPLPILIFGTFLGLVTLAAVVAAWRTRRRVWARVAAGARILSALTAVPAFFVPDVPAPLVVAASASIVLTAVAVYLLLRRPATER